jgi:putative PIN family toxin of toxin-antitoxin system
MPIKAVLDTNVLVSSLVSQHSPPRHALDAWLEGQYTLVTSLYLVEELIHVLSYPRIARQVHLEEDELAAILAALLSQAEVTPGRLHLPGVTRDPGGDLHPKDDAIVACAVEGEADYIVSGDQDLLVLGQYETVQVITPRQFVDILAPPAPQPSNSPIR